MKMECMLFFGTQKIIRHCMPLDRNVALDIMQKPLSNIYPNTQEWVSPLTSEISGIQTLSTDHDKLKDFLRSVNTENLWKKQPRE